MRKLENIPVSGLLFQNGVLSMLINRSKSLAYTELPQTTLPVLDGFK